MELENIPPGKKVIGSKLVSKLKIPNLDGSISKHQVRLVAKGYSQKEG